MSCKSSFDELLYKSILKCGREFVEDFSNQFYSLYPFTTENIAGYIHYFSLNNKTLCTVGSSGDQILNASLFDCKNIVSLDICPYTKFYAFLKIACLLELKREDYLTFFCKNARSFENEVFQKMKSTLRLLDYESYLFWDELFSCFQGFAIREWLFINDEYPKKVLLKINPYLQSNLAYEEVRKKIKKTKLEFITGDVLKVDLEGFFDSIWLSNIGTYYSRHFLKKIVDNVSKFLNVDGTLLISYLYNCTKKTLYQEDWEPIYDLSKTFEILKDYNPEMHSFLGIDGITFDANSRQDSVLLYRKIK